MKQQEAMSIVARRNFVEETIFTTIPSSRDWLITKGSEVKVGEFNLEYELPEITESELNIALVSGLEELKSELRAKSQLEENKIQEEINKLLALPAPEVSHE